MHIALCQTWNLNDSHTGIVSIVIKMFVLPQKRLWLRYLVNFLLSFNFFPKQGKLEIEMFGLIPSAIKLILQMPMTMNK